MTETLNQPILKLLGYRVTTHEEDGLISYVPVFPDGSTRIWNIPAGVYQQMTPILSFPTEAEAWQLAPDIEHSLDACSDALPHGYDITILSSIGGGYSVIIRKDNPPSGYSGVWWGGGGATRAEAMAEALYLYLLWKTQQEVE